LLNAHFEKVEIIFWRTFHFLDKSENSGNAADYVDIFDPDQFESDRVKHVIFSLYKKLKTVTTGHGSSVFTCFTF
jgi:hypothetical protein